MSDAQSAPGRAGDGRRLPAALNALWVGGAASPDLTTAVHAFEQLVEAARLACSRWPDFYHGPGWARLIHSVEEPPPSEITEAASRCGMRLTAFELTAQSAAEQCDLALAAPSAAVAAQLLILAAAPDGEAGPIALYETVSPFRPVARRRTLAAGAAIASEIARAVLSPPRQSGEAAKLRDYQNEDMRAAPARFEYNLLLRLIGERPPADAGPDHSWDDAAALAE